MYFLVSHKNQIYVMYDVIYTIKQVALIEQ